MTCGEGTVVLRFVVDTLGVPELSSVASIRSAPKVLVSASTDALARSVYSPASINGHRVRQWVTQPYNFTIATVCPPRAPNATL